MTPQFSLAHLTMLACSPPELIEIAARTGYDYVSLRPIPVGAPNEPLHPFGTDRALFERTRNALAATGLRLLDVEVARIVEGVSPTSYLPAIAAAAELGGKHVLSSVWCSDGGYIVDSFSELCELAKPFGLTVDLEFVTWSGVRSLGEAAAVVTAANCANAGILIDTLHFDRSHANPGILGAFPRKWFHFAQICDGPAQYSTEESEMIRIGRSARLYVGEGGIDVASITRRIPAVPLSIEIPNAERLSQLGPEGYARSCLDSARSYLVASAHRLAS